MKPERSAETIVAEHPPIRMFKFTMTNKVGDTATYLGQGLTEEEARAEGLNNCNDPFRPSSNGERRPDHGLAVVKADGRRVSRTLRDFYAGK